MKLKDLEIFTVAPPAPGWGGRYWTFVKLTTDNGIVGYGECYASTVGPRAMNAVIEDVFERHMLGENPENIELMYRRAYSAGFTQRPDPTVMGAFHCRDHFQQDEPHSHRALHHLTLLAPLDASFLLFLLARAQGPISPSD